MVFCGSRLKYPFTFSFFGLLLFLGMLASISVGYLKERLKLVFAVTSQGPGGPSCCVVIWYFVASLGFFSGALCYAMRGTAGLSRIWVVTRIKCVLWSNKYFCFKLEIRLRMCYDKKALDKICVATLAKQIGLRWNILHLVLQTFALKTANPYQFP